MNIVEFYVKEGWRITSDPATYKDGWGIRNYKQWDPIKKYWINHDSYCDGEHNAFDFGGSANKEVRSFGDGEVVAGTKDYGNFGATVVVAYPQFNIQVIYGHLQRPIKWKVGDKVSKFDVIGLQGNTNYSNVYMDPHLHLQVQPLEYFADEKAFVCTGIDARKIDIGEYKSKGNDTVVKTHLIVAGHGNVDPGAIGNGTNERDFTRNHIVDRVAKYINATPGHKAVVYNKKNNMFVDTQYGSGYGMYWAKAQGYATVTEYHLDAASASARGGHVIVYNGFAPDKIDLGIRDALKKYVGIRYSHKGHSGISGRNNLLQVNVAANIGVNYRLVELGFITNKADFQAINKNVEALTRDMANAITGGTSSAKASDKKKPATPKPKPNVTSNKKDSSSKTPRTIGSWQTNKINGAQYIRAEGTFTVTAKDGIISRFHNPSTNAKHGGLAKKGWSAKYDYLVRANGYVWIQYKVNGKGAWKFIPFNTWNSKTGAVGKTAWGTFS